MLTIDNNRLLRESLNFGLKLQPKALKNNISLNNKYPNITNALSQDIFTRNNSINNGSNGISFTAYYNGNEDYSLKPISEVELGNEYYAKLATEIQKKMDEAWSWTSKRPRYKQYFSKLNIEKPKLVFVTKKDYPDYDEGRNYELSHSNCVPTQYNWVNNTIIVDLDYFPNVVLASNGMLALSPKATVGDFIKNNNKPDPNARYGGYVSVSDFEDLGKRSLDFAITDSSENGKHYYSILDPKEAAEIAPSLLTHEMEHVVAMHVILNTAGVDMQKFKDVFNRLNDSDMLPPKTTDRWTNSYPYRYRKGLKSMAYGKNDIWKIRDEDGNSLKRITHKEVLDEFFREYNPHDPYSSEFQNLIELDARYASISYLNIQKLDDFSESDAENLGTVLDIQESVIREDIKKRLEWTNLARAAKKFKLSSKQKR